MLSDSCDFVADGFFRLLDGFFVVGGGLVCDSHDVVVEAWERLWEWDPGAEVAELVEDHEEQLGLRCLVGRFPWIIAVCFIEFRCRWKVTDDRAEFFP